MKRVKVKTIKPPRKKVKAINFRGLDAAQLSMALNLNPRTIARWKVEYDPPVPFDENNLFDIAKVLEWYAQKAVSMAASPVGNNLDEKKVNAQIDNLKKDAQIKEERIRKLQSQTVPIETHEQVVESLFGTLRSFLVETLQQNAHHFASKSVDEVRVLFSQLALEASQEITRAIGKDE